MKARKIMIAVFAAVLAMQMTGCKNNIDTEKPVVIDVSVSDSDVESKAELTWTELGKLTTYEKMRTAVDTVFDNAQGDDGLKYGPFYIDKSGNQCTNNTLKVVLGNRYVAEMFATGGNVDIEKIDSSNLGAIEIPEETTEGTETTDEESSAMTKSINNSLDAVYTDLSDSDYTPALFNAYFNLLPDSTPNYFNGGDTLSRAEAMALVTRATTPVQSLTAVDDFTSAVTGTDYDQYINYAAQQNASSYINTQDKSLTADNFKGAMSRAEFIYLIMNEVYTPEAVQAFDTSKSALKDCTNAGDLSAELKITGSDRCNGYTLSHSLKNVDKGVTEELYKPLAMAVDKGIITPETRWNEGITKSEAIEIVVNAFSAYYDENGYLVNNADKGSTQVLEAQAEELWNKQDANDMNCTKEEFIADYIKEISNGMTPERFEEEIGGRYSIKVAEEIAEKEQESLLKTHINALWEVLQDRLTCDKSTFTDEYKSQFDKQGDSFTEEGFTEYILDKYGIKEETPSNNGGGGNSSSNNNDGGSSNGGGSSNNNGGGSSNNNGGGSSNNGGNTGGGSSNGGSSNNGGGNTGGGSSNNNTPAYTPPADNGGGSDGDDFADLPIMVDGEEDIDLDDIHLG